MATRRAGQCGVVGCACLCLHPVQPARWARGCLHLAVYPSTAALCPLAPLLPPPVAQQQPCFLSCMPNNRPPRLQVLTADAAAVTGGVSVSASVTGLTLTNDLGKAYAVAGLGDTLDLMPGTIDSNTAEDSEFDVYAIGAENVTPLKVRDFRHPRFSRLACGSAPWLGRMLPRLHASLLACFVDRVPACRMCLPGAHPACTALH